ncbi:hypothetical protein MDAP_002319 [Mitosporidium daphniae]|uniref:Transcription factor CBF/NF-Y/archaeal histone domain-containing protein n=1 Tax=Mitosporidium daphniae TaxID=1485682 RepID=A0A098VRX7_9MICR|nr:uncharacterized protein DI09_28p60 [Mitosporidium daphniae]KGG51725.1 hypothetical protein DI09_28p60 [Mitosporidium daphniae]|eukprot:XP_013238177.1 uncharacterized protein DI09_28p60 [Mitosporidium daphniae]
MDASKFIPIVDEDDERAGSDALIEDSAMIKMENEYSDSTADNGLNSRTRNLTPQISIGNTLPASKIRKILKEYDELSIISKDSLFLITAATELFIQYFASRAFELAKGKRKTVLYSDLIQLAKQDERFMFVSNDIDNPEFTGLSSSSTQLVFKTIADVEESTGDVFEK